MPGTLSNADINFPTFTGSTEKQLQEVESYLYMLLENLRYSLANIGTENMNSDELDKIIKMSAEQIDLTGYVTFNSLAEEGQTIINGSNITTGTISASRIDAENLEVDAANVSGTFSTNNFKGNFNYVDSSGNLVGTFGVLSQTFANILSLRTEHGAAQVAVGEISAGSGWVGKVLLNGGIVLEEGKSFGSTEQRDALSAQDGQLFFVIS